jgi:hypothetical protein
MKGVGQRRETRVVSILCPACFVPVNYASVGWLCACLIISPGPSGVSSISRVSSSRLGDSPSSARKVFGDAVSLPGRLLSVSVAKTS